MKKQFKVLLLIAMICVLALATMLVSSALAAEQGDNAWQVEGKGYAATFAEAVAGAADGDTIKLLKDVTEASGATIDKNVVVDGQGFTWTFENTEGANHNLIVTAANVKFTNVKLVSALPCNDLAPDAEAGTSYSYTSIVYAKTAGMLWFENVKATGCRLVCDLAGTHTKITGANTEMVLDRQVVWSDKSTVNDGTIASWGKQKVTIAIEGGSIKCMASDGFRLGGQMVEISVNGGYLYCAEDMFYPQGGGSHLTIIGNTTIEVGSNIWANSVKLTVPEGAPEGTVVPVNNIIVGGNVTLKTLGVATAANQGHIFNSENETNYVIGSASGVDANGIADNIVMYGTGSSTDGCASIIKQSSTPTTIKIYSGDFYSRDMNFWFNAILANLEIFDGTFMISGIPTKGGYHSNIYHNCKLGSKVVIHYAEMGYVRNIDVNNMPLNVAIKNEFGGTNAVPVYAGSGEGVDVTIYDGIFFSGAANGPVLANKANGKVKIYGGYFGSSSGGGNAQLGANSTMDFYGGEFHGYAWARPEGANCVVNIWGGTYYSMAAQDNCHGIRIAGADTVCNVYGGTFTFLNDSGADANSVISVQSAAVVNLYGGHFTNFSTNKDSAVLYVGNAAAAVTVYEPGTEITWWDGTTKASTGVIFERGNVPTVIKAVDGAVVNVQGGTQIKLTNVAGEWAPVYQAANAETGAVEVLGIVRGSGVKLENTEDNNITFVLDKTTWCFPNTNAWAANDYDYVINAWRDIQLDGGALEFATTDPDGEEMYSFDGNFEGTLTPAALNELAAAYIRYLFWDDEDLALYDNYWTDEADGDRQNVFINLTAPSTFIITEKTYTATGDFGTAYGNVFTVNGGKLIFDDVTLESTYLIVGPCQIVNAKPMMGTGAVVVNGGEFVIKSGTYAAGGRTPLVEINGGTVSIEGGNFERTMYTWQQSDAIIEMIAGNLAISGGSFHSYVGGAFVKYTDNWDTDGSNTVVSGGTFVHENKAGVPTGLSYKGGIFFVGNSSVNERHFGTLTITDGTFTAPGWVRNYSVCNALEDFKSDNADATCVPHPTKKFVVNISGGDFASNSNSLAATDDRYMFQFARTGGHEMYITGGTFTAPADGASGYFFNANASANGSKVVATGVTFDGAQNWINSGKIMTWNFTNCVFTNTTGGSIGNSKRMINLGGTDTATFTNCMFILEDNVALFGTNANSNVTMTGCLVNVAGFANTDVAASFSITNTLIIINGNGAEEAVIKFSDTVMDKVTIVCVPTEKSAAAMPTAGLAKFTEGVYAKVLYAGVEAYAWSTNKASSEFAPSVTNIGVLNVTGNAASSGIKFFSSVPAAVVAALSGEGKTLKYGTLVAPADYVAKAGAFTPAALDAAGLTGTAYVKIPAVNTLVVDGDGNVTFAGALVNLKSTTRAYAAVAYIEVYEGETLVETVYGAYSTDTNAMTAKFAAAAILANTDVVAALSPEQKALLESYVA